MRIIDIKALSDQSITITLADKISLQGSQKVQTVYQKLHSQPIKGIVTVIPAFNTITVFYDVVVLMQHFSKKTAIYQQFCKLLRDYINDIDVQHSQSGANLITIPVCYEKNYALDLQEVAKIAKLTVDEVIDLHSKTTYHTYMLGFAPGFPFLGGLDPRLIMPRKITPRLEIPAGCVGIAGAQTGIYPLATPGGWQIIGRTPIKLYDFNSKQPTLIKMGDKVRFQPISEYQYLSLKQENYCCLV